MQSLLIENNTIQHIQKGRYLLQETDFINPSKLNQLDEGTVIELFSQSNQFIARAMVGRQNKGIGWVFTEDIGVQWGPQLIEERINSAIENRSQLFQSQETTAFRLINGEGDGLAGVTVDWYAGYLQFNWYSRGIYLHRERLLDTLLEFLPQTKGVYETKRYRISEGEMAIELTHGQEAPQPLMIKENNVDYAVCLGEDWMTGIFLDQREVRDFVRTQSQGMEVLNLFSYTGAFSVAAAVGGASKTISVDVAKRSVERTKEQFAVNDIAAEQPTHEVRAMDVFDYIQYAKLHDLQFDLIVCDPPSFARTKNNQFRAEKDYKELAIDLFRLTKSGGMCILSTNHSTYFKSTFQKDMNQALQSIGGEYHLIQSFGLPEDFPTTADQESQYLKVLVYYRSK